LARYFFDDEEFKEKYIRAIEALQKKLLGESEDEHSLCFGRDLNSLRDAELINTRDNVDLDNDVISEDGTTEICYTGFKGEYGYMAHNDDGYVEINNTDLINFFELDASSRVIDNLELIHPTLYLQRVDIAGTEAAIFKNFFVNYGLRDSKLKIGLNTEANFLFSYKLHKINHPEPLYLDSFIEIRGDKLDLEECRAICKALIFEMNCISGVVVTPQPNSAVTFDYDAYDKHVEEIREQLKIFCQVEKSLLICKDTEKVIDIYNKANSCNDYEMSILFFSKAIEYVSETVVRSAVTEMGRKALSSNRAMMPDANFIRELQELFQKHSFKSDSESMNLTIQTCCYINDLLPLIPLHIQNKFEKHRQKSDQDALGFLASCVSATRNNIAHAKANYRFTGNEIPEEFYDTFTGLMRVICQQCIRWYAAQSPSMRIVS
jgi:hypothetical protein